MATNTPCDSEVFANGSSVCVLDARSNQAEAWVQSVAKESGQRVDWHYSGGRANVLFIGDRKLVLAAVEKLASTLDGTILRIVAEDERGPYRAGDPVPDGVIAIV